ncbi:MAG: tRNA (adenosine(37)-N6)-threonylcarbamoyltransferase complex dimerization subunit type 1 TsaB [Magnetococcales bacterium]|nr:tRNA (adenosine(37)-N6)-threonylcarbamoyltransferase complex dimerization subunit type 1 TsaB [Magnetococcales bacterium]
MNILAMDTSDREGCAALLAEGRLVGQRRFQGVEGHMLLLPQAVEALLAAAAWRPASLDLIVVTVGPGAFTGLRIALGFAKGLAMACHKPLLGISTLDWLAATALSTFPPLSPSRPLLVTMDARRGEIFAALYHPDGRPLWPPRRWLPAALAAEIASIPEGVEEVKDGQREPVVLGQLGWQRFLRTGSDDPLTLEPLYLRRSDAEKAVMSPPQTP